MDPISTFVQWLLDQVSKGWDWIVAQIQIPPPPQWIIDGVAALQGIEAQASALHYWIPIPVMIGVFAWGAVLVVAALVIQVVRIIASFATLGGGGT